MSEEKSFCEELKAILSACTFADLARAVEPSSGRWQPNPYYARAEKVYEALPKIVRKRFANLKVFDSADLVIGMINRDKRTPVRLGRSRAREPLGY